MSADIPLFLFAKAPIPGKVKTRLQTHCSSKQAAQIASILIEQSIRLAIKYWPGSLYLSVWLDQDHPFLQKMQQRYAVKLVEQCDGDLGAKMRESLARFGYPAAVMGCDAPHATPDALQLAHHQLSNGKSVIGASDDGGYYFLGLSAPADYLFDDIPWGGDQVLDKTYNLAAIHQLELGHLSSLNDIDLWADLVSAADVLPVLADYLRDEKLI